MSSSSQQQDQHQSCRLIHVRDHEIILHDHPDFSSADRTLVGSWLWDCSLVLADFLPSFPIEGKSVIELGAGTGLPSLVAAKLGASRVVLTDLPYLLPGLRRNTDANSFPSDIIIEIMPLRWGSTEDAAALNPPFDVVLMSDILYDPEMVPELCLSLRELTNENSFIVVADELRMNTSECFEEVKRGGFGWVKVISSSDQPHPIGHNDVIEVFKLFYLKEADDHNNNNNNNNNNNDKDDDP